MAPSTLGSVAKRARHTEAERAQTDDTRVRSITPMVPPACLMQDVPSSPELQASVAERRAAIRAVLSGEDDRVLIVAGPCTVHDPEATLDYARRLAELARRHAKDVVIVMRLNFRKPSRTSGWKGFLHDPHRDGSCAINRGLQLARQLMVRPPPRSAGSPPLPARRPRSPRAARPPVRRAPTNCRAGARGRARPGGGHVLPRHAPAAVLRRPRRLALGLAACYRLAGEFLVRAKRHSLLRSSEFYNERLFPLMLVSVASCPSMPFENPRNDSPWPRLVAAGLVACHCLARQRPTRARLQKGFVHFCRARPRRCPQSLRGHAMTTLLCFSALARGFALPGAPRALLRPLDARGLLRPRRHGRRLLVCSRRGRGRSARAAHLAHAARLPLRCGR